MSLADTLYQLTPSPAALLLLLLLIALVESLALVGLLVPGVLLITAAASLAGHQELALVWVIGVAFIGAVIGDGVSFGLGYLQRERVTRLWPLSRHPEWLARGARFFRRYGPFSVFFGRFIGPVRPVIPLIAGMLHMRPLTFIWANLASAALWAPAYILPGYLLGRTWEQLLDFPPGFETWLITFALIVVGLAVVFSWGRAQLAREGRLYRLTAGVARRVPLLRRPWLAMSQSGEVPLASTLLLVISLGALSGWTLMVLSHHGPMPMDTQLQQLVMALQTPFLNQLSQIMASIGDKYGVLALFLPWGLWLLAKRHIAALLHWLAALGGIALLNIWGKNFFARPRPETPDYLTGSLAYPSAHSSTAVVLFGLAAAFVAAELPHHKRFWIYWVAMALALPMALSRLVLGVHWFSDLVGGALLGLVVCALVQLNWQSRPRRSLSPCPWQALTVASLVLVSARVVLLSPV
ncbi:bifunctional DedA family/phosphatase PAP2 family protein [Vreelandella rituensis]|uniref:Phosphatase PAP2 family protein n=1 Tax=Vreelandella rituensis TaxID=2282306 RepID=A0A368U105_9GAMM|nr:bifunctional DedA family/phosphatase PAP2 family protein [Halomonas rituensis]RCV88783.1 phosphatase PAP2 family protein [Halomonas rituensis]